jgi:hypothetical protein
VRTVRAIAGGNSMRFFLFSGRGFWFMVFYLIVGQVLRVVKNGVGKRRERKKRLKAEC